MLDLDVHHVAMWLVGTARSDEMTRHRDAALDAQPQALRRRFASSTLVRSAVRSEEWLDGVGRIITSGRMAGVGRDGTVWVGIQHATCNVQRATAAAKASVLAGCPCLCAGMTQRRDCVAGNGRHQRLQVWPSCVRHEQSRDKAEQTSWPGKSPTSRTVKANRTLRRWSRWRHPICSAPRCRVVISGRLGGNLRDSLTHSPAFCMCVLPRSLFSAR